MCLVQGESVDTKTKEMLYKIFSIAIGNCHACGYLFCAEWIHCVAPSYIKHFAVIM